MPKRNTHVIVTTPVRPRMITAHFGIVLIYLQCGTESGSGKARERPFNLLAAPKVPRSVGKKRRMPLPVASCTAYRTERISPTQNAELLGRNVR